MLRVQGPEGGPARDRREARCDHRAGRDRPPGGPAAAHHRAARQRRRRLPALVGALRSRDDGCLRGAGRDRRRHRHAAARDHACRSGPEPRAKRYQEPRGVRVGATGPCVADQAWPVHAAGDHPLREGDRDRSAVRGTSGVPIRFLQADGHVRRRPVRRGHVEIEGTGRAGSGDRSETCRGMGDAGSRGRAVRSQLRAIRLAVRAGAGA